MRAGTRFALGLTALLGLLGSSGGVSHADDDGRDLINAVRVRDALVALDAGPGLRRERDLHIGEAVLAVDSRGEIAIARTSDRLLGVHLGDDWRELSYRVEEREQPPRQSHVARRSALVVLGRRIAAFTARSPGWFTASLEPGEDPVQAYASRQFVAAATPRRLLAVDPELGFVQIRLAADERPLDASGADDILTVTTTRRVLSYGLGSGQWADLGRSAR